MLSWGKWTTTEGEGLGTRSPVQDQRANGAFQARCNDGRRVPGARSPPYPFSMELEIAPPSPFPLLAPPPSSSPSFPPFPSQARASRSCACSSPTSFLAGHHAGHCGLLCRCRPRLGRHSKGDGGTVRSCRCQITRDRVGRFAKRESRQLHGCGLSSYHVFSPSHMGICCGWLLFLGILVHNRAYAEPSSTWLDD